MSDEFVCYAVVSPEEAECAIIIVLEEGKLADCKARYGATKAVFMPFKGSTSLYLASREDFDANMRSEHASKFIRVPHPDHESAAQLRRLAETPIEQLWRA